MKFLDLLKNLEHRLSNWNIASAIKKLLQRIRNDTAPRIGKISDNFATLVRYEKLRLINCEIFVLSEFSKA